MRLPPSPSCTETTVVDSHTWRPASLSGLRKELITLVSTAKGYPDECTILFRGHARSFWEVESTFARNVRGHFDAKEKWYGNRLHQELLDKFGKQLRPSAELLKISEDDPAIDPWFELMKRVQQHPEQFSKQTCIPGSNLVDWSLEFDVALAFATEIESESGAIYLFDACSSGPIFMRRQVRDILDLMQQNIVQGHLPGLPLVFCPSRQIGYERAERQKARYVAQMDLRFSLDHAWRNRENALGDGHRIFHRLEVAPSVKKEACAVLLENGPTIPWLLNRQE